jgi:hypothetical protein
MSARVEFCDVDPSTRLAVFWEIWEDSASEDTLSDVLLELYGMEAVLRPELNVLSTSDLHIARLCSFQVTEEGKRAQYNELWCNPKMFSSQR